jgi:hypothetical protein
VLDLDTLADRFEGGVGLEGGPSSRVGRARGWAELEEGRAQNRLGWPPEALDRSVK